MKLTDWLTIILMLLLLPPQLHADGNFTAYREFNQLNTHIRDNNISRNAALGEMRRLLPLVKNYYFSNGGGQLSRSEWRFPIEGYTLQATGNRGRDYVASGYDFFSGNRHGGHPSFDLFIRDKNRDDLDDRTGKPVHVLSMSGGIVVSVANEWEAESKLRGGKYVWVYDPTNELLLYYAHNRDILVTIGDIIKPGDRIATVGRTGLNARKKRSPTHLHLTCLKLDNGYPKPENIFQDLKRIGK
ncbi:MAG: M23 family metallopeptidase [Geobacteraceae bacterium]|nr:M23 family metallopeptidase [Geobacteraceae bacterium]